MLIETSFRAMGGRCRLVADGVDKDVLAQAAQLVAELERLWSRFRPESEVSQMNESNGSLCLVSKPTFELVARAVEAHSETQGLFNPLMLDQLIGLGYDKSFDLGVGARDVATALEFALPATPLDIELLEAINAVRLPPGASFDPGGIGKGMAADTAVSFLNSAGASTAYADIGGDLAFAGSPWVGDAWQIEIGHPDDDETIARLSLDRAGAVATSSTRGRRWFASGNELHHLLDPSSGRPSESDLIGVSVVDLSAARAEVLSKAILIAGSHAMPELAARCNVSGIAVSNDGRIVDLSGAHLGSTYRVPRNSDNIDPNRSEVAA